MLALGILFTTAVPAAGWQNWWSDTRQDYASFYTATRWTRIGTAFGVGAVIANSSIDQNLFNAYQEHVRSATTDDIARAVKPLGDLRYLLPVALGALVADGGWDAPQGAGRWATDVMRAVVVGGPATLALQRVTGGSRPGETTHDSQWRPLHDANGVSGHAFIGAIPWLVMGRLADPGFWRYAAYAASTLAALSRVNDAAHYPSQIVLGWYLAWESVDTVTTDPAKVSAWRLTPLPVAGGAELCLQARW